MCKKTARKTEQCSLEQHRFSIRFVSVFVSSVCLLVRVNMSDMTKAVVSCLLAASAIMSEMKKKKRKMWSKNWYLKRNIHVSCVAHLLIELLETECLEMMPLWCRQVN
jgi:hypothetical protein